MVWYDAVRYGTAVDCTAGSTKSTTFASRWTIVSPSLLLNHTRTLYLCSYTIPSPLHAHAHLLTWTLAHDAHPPSSPCHSDWHSYANLCHLEHLGSYSSPPSSLAFCNSTSAHQMSSYHLCSMCRCRPRITRHQAARYYYLRQRSTLSA